MNFQLLFDEQWTQVIISLKCLLWENKVNFQYIEIYTWLGGFGEEKKKQNLKEISFSIIFLSLRAKYEFQHIEICIFEDY